MSEAPLEGKLTVDDSWRQLADAVIGRLSLGLPGIRRSSPPTSSPSGRSIAFRTAAGTKLLKAMEVVEAAFEIDGYDDRTEEAWTVVAKGTAAPIESRERSAVVRSLIWSLPSGSGFSGGVSPCCGSGMVRPIGVGTPPW